mgnify:CR=1 FL=1
MFNLLGILGGTIVVISFFFKDIHTIRKLNIVATIILLIYSLVISSYIFAGINIAVMVINGYRLMEERKGRKAWFKEYQKQYDEHWRGKVYTGTTVMYCEKCKKETYTIYDGKFCKKCKDYDQK